MTHAWWRYCLSLVLLPAACSREETNSDPADPGRPVEGICPDNAASDAFAQCVESFNPAHDATFGHDALPGIVLGPPVSSGGSDASLDVASLGCGGQITLHFGRDGIPNLDGPDFTVFENPLGLGDESFAEPAQVWVSEEGNDWRPFECDLHRGWPPTGCAGVEPVAADPDNGWATDPWRSGGDQFDLDDVGLSRARYVRLVDQSIEYHGTAIWCGAAGGFDLDSIARVEPPV